MPSPHQIGEKVFPVVRRGYDCTAVDEFLEAVAVEHHRVLAQLAVAGDGPPPLPGPEGGRAVRAAAAEPDEERLMTRDRREGEEELPSLVDALHTELEELRRQLADTPPAPAPSTDAADLPDAEDDLLGAGDAELAEAVALGRVSGMLEWLTEDFADGLAGALNGGEDHGPDRARRLGAVRAGLRAGLRRLEAALDEPAG